MRKDPGLIYKIVLALGDVVAVVFSFLFTYYFRTHFSNRPYFFKSNGTEFALSLATLIPAWIIVFAALGLYRSAVISSRSREVWRLFLASIIGTMTMITLDYFFELDLFPVRYVPVVATALSFVSMFIIRIISRKLRKLSFRRDHGTMTVLLVGNDNNTKYLARYILDNPGSGYRLVGAVAGNSFLPEDARDFAFTSVEKALEGCEPDLIFQTDDKNTEYVYSQAVQHHLRYYFVPSEAALSTQLGEIQIIAGTPIIAVKVTPLMGGAKIIKRITDLILGLLFTVIALIPMAIIAIISKISDPKAKVLYKQTRLSRYNEKFTIYKFRSMKPEFSGMSPEKAFEKMGRPELSEEYRKNGDQLDNDPRITKFGRFIRATSLDELPQLFNVLKGDISLVGPRALVPGELRNYGDRSLLLSVKSGLTGLAQVSGRRNLSFEERRALDIYYVQNWTFALDLKILLKTIAIVILRKGAK